MADRFDAEHYGELDYGTDFSYPLVALRSREWNETLPTMLVTGGVHGYDTSGVHGALRGRQDTRTPMIITVIAYWGVAMPTAIWLAFPANMGPAGIWISSKSSFLYFSASAAISS